MSDDGPTCPAELRVAAPQTLPSSSDTKKAGGKSPAADLEDKKDGVETPGLRKRQSADILPPPDVPSAKNASGKRETGHSGDNEDDTDNAGITRDRATSNTFQADHNAGLISEEMLQQCVEIVGKHARARHTEFIHELYKREDGKLLNVESSPFFSDKSTTQLQFTSMRDGQGNFVNTPKLVSAVP